MPGPLVSTQWVEDHLGDPSIRILDICDRPVYLRGHPPGAVWVGWEDHLCVTVNGIEHMAPRPEDAARIFGAWNIQPDTMVVAMDDRISSRSARAFWLLRLYGHQQVAIMDGARAAWLSEGRPLTTREPAAGGGLYPVSPADRLVNATWDEVLEASNSRSTTLLDVRRAAEFTGSEARAKRGGHVPGAQHLPWEAATRDDGSFKPTQDLRRLYEEAGISRDAAVISYCQAGVRAAHTWFVLSQLLGNPHARNYDGSWYEWGNRDDLPIDQGGEVFRGDLPPVD